MTSTLDDSFLLLDQDTNQFLVQMRIKSQISYSTIKKTLFLIDISISLKEHIPMSIANKFCIH